jgi:hypothetical protein
MDSTGLPELDGFELTPLYCDDSPTYGMMVYGVHAPEKMRAFLFHEWSCGSGGCSVKLELHTHEETLGDASLFRGVGRVAVRAAMSPTHAPCLRFRTGCRLKRSAF